MFLGTALRLIVIEVELLIGLGAFTGYRSLTNSEFYDIYLRVSPWVLRSLGERERTQTNS